MTIMRVKYEKTGSDIIPNKAFWISLPSLVKVNNYVINTKLNNHLTKGICKAVLCIPLSS